MCFARRIILVLSYNHVPVMSPSSQLFGVLVLHHLSQSLDASANGGVPLMSPSLILLVKGQFGHSISQHPCHFGSNTSYASCEHRVKIREQILLVARLRKGF